MLRWRLPFTRSSLTKKAHGWIPWGIGAIQEPAEIGLEGEQCPYGLAHRAARWANGCVGGNDQIEIGDQGAVSA